MSGLLKQLSKEAWNTSLAAAKCFCLFKLFNNHICTLVLTYGPSMLPTFNITPALILAERVSPPLGKVGTGDIVILRMPDNPRKTVTKRVKGMEGDSVAYISDPKNSDSYETVVVPKGYVWVEGDNIYNSNDSRNFGTIPYALIEARAFWRVWPPNEFGPLGPRAN